jgi:hypothetical protein
MMKSANDKNKISLGIDKKREFADKARPERAFDSAYSAAFTAFFDWIRRIA